MWEYVIVSLIEIMILLKKNDGYRFMKTARLSIRMSDRRLNKLRQYAASKDKTLTQIVKDWIDRLPVVEIDKNLNTPF